MATGRHMERGGVNLRGGALPYLQIRSLHPEMENAPRPPPGESSPPARPRAPATSHRGRRLQPRRRRLATRGCRPGVRSPPHEAERREPRRHLHRRSHGLPRCQTLVAARGRWGREGWRRTNPSRPPSRPREDDARAPEASSRSQQSTTLTTVCNVHYCNFVTYQELCCICYDLVLQNIRRISCHK